MRKILSVKQPLTGFKHLLLALFLCVGMIGLSGAGAGPLCPDTAVKECGCCPMAPGEACCSATEEPVPTQTPLLPENRPTQAGDQAVLLHRPLLFVLPAGAPQLTFSIEKTQPILSSAGVSAQAMLCVRTV